LPLTKEFKALKVWMTIKAYGAKKIRKEISSDIAKAKYLSELVKENDRMELMAPVPLSIVCFRYNPGGMVSQKLDDLNDRIIEEIESDGRVFLTGTKIQGQTALRTCFINHRTEKSDVDYLLDVVLDLADKVSD
jgi:glutamate/tyrosine decarboxylase-like PLP-dependent enzyme